MKIKAGEEGKVLYKGNLDRRELLLTKDIREVRAPIRECVFGIT